MKINSVHIKIVKIIQSYKFIAFEDLCESLSLNNFTVKNYLKEIELYLELKDYNLSIGEIITEIFSDKKLIYRLRKDQEFTKQERIDYLIFKILKEDIVNLSDVAKDIGVSKRTLNYHLVEIKEFMSSYKAEIKFSKNGILLCTTNYKKAMILYMFLFKITSERIFFVHKFRKEITDYVHKSKLKKHTNYRILYKKICEIISPIYSEYSYHVFNCVYLSFWEFEGDKTIKNLTDEKLLRYKPTYLDKKKYYKIIEILKLTPLGNLQAIFLDYLFLNLAHCTYTCKQFPDFVVKKSLEIKPYISEFIGDNNFKDKNYITFVAPWVHYAYIRDKLKFFDFYYAVTGLNFPNTLKVRKTIGNIRKHVPLFSRFDLFLFSYIFKSYEKYKLKNKVLVYDKIPKKIIDIIAENLELTHNISIVKIVSLNEFYYFYEENSIDCIVTVENLNIKTASEVINYSIPI